MGDGLDAFALRCSQCRAIVEMCSVCGDRLGIGVARCTPHDGKHHHASCENERHRRNWLASLRAARTERAERSAADDR